MIGWLIMVQLALGTWVLVRSWRLLWKVRLDRQAVIDSGQNGMMLEATDALLHSARMRVVASVVLGWHPFLYLFMPSKLDPDIRRYITWLVTQLALIIAMASIASVNIRQERERAVLAARSDEARKRELKVGA